MELGHKCNVMDIHSRDVENDRRQYYPSYPCDCLLAQKQDIFLLFFHTLMPLIRQAEFQLQVKEFVHNLHLPLLQMPGFALKLLNSSGAS